MASEDSRRRVARRTLFDGSSLNAWPFLLIARTGRIVTVPEGTSTARYSGFPANSQLHSQDHSCEGQTRSTFRDSCLRQCCYSPFRAERVARSFLPGSPCRHGARTVSSPLRGAALGVQSLRIPRGSARGCGPAACHSRSSRKQAARLARTRCSRGAPSGAPLAQWRRNAGSRHA